jgi:hypothetical protein
VSDDRLVERLGDPRAERRVEYAVNHSKGGSSSSPFPIEWGVPPGRDGTDPQRRAWIRSHAEAAQATKPLRELAERDAALLVYLRRALLEQCRSEEGLR